MSLTIDVNKVFEYYNTSIPLSLAQNQSGVSDIYLNLNGYAAGAESSLENGWYVEYLIASSSFGAFDIDSDSLTNALSSNKVSKGVDFYGYASFVGVASLLDIYGSSYATDSSYLFVTVDCEGDRACLKSIFGLGLELDDIVSVINSTLPSNATNNDLYNAINSELPTTVSATLDCGATMSCAFGVVTMHSGKHSTGNQLVATISNYYDSIDQELGYAYCDQDCHDNVTSMIENYISNEITINDVNDFQMYSNFTFTAPISFTFDVDGLFSYYNGIIITQGVGTILHGLFQAEFAGYGGRIYCLPNDYCLIDCEAVFGCWNLELICYPGSICQVSCGPDSVYPSSYCPIGWDGTGTILLSFLCKKLHTTYTCTFTILQSSAFCFLELLQKKNIL